MSGEWFDPVTGTACCGAACCCAMRVLRVIGAWHTRCHPVDGGKLRATIDSLVGKGAESTAIRWQPDGNQMAIRWQSDGNQMAINQMAIRWQSDGNQMAIG